ncbi:MAG: cupin domain-containing protein, partial [Patescibacteria group bacterium]
MKTKFEVLKLTNGRLIISKTGKDLSTGLLHLFPESSLEKHNRPVDEQLIQVRGKSVIELRNGRKINKAELREGDELFIPARQFHTHTNPFDTDSVTAWRFDGDITEVIEELRK